MKHVIVAGGAGFVGSHVCDALLGRGYAVTAMDNLSTGTFENLRQASASPFFRFLQADISRRIPSEELDCLETEGLEGVIHVACPWSGEEKDLRIRDALRVDSVGTLQTIEIAHDFRARYLLVSPRLRPSSHLDPWALSRRFAEICVDNAIRFDEPSLNGAVLRLDPVYGPRMSKAAAAERKAATSLSSVCLLHSSEAVRAIVDTFESEERGFFESSSPRAKSAAEVARYAALSTLPGGGWLRHRQSRVTIRPAVNP